MGNVRIRSLEDMVRWQADLKLICRCGRVARYQAGQMQDYFRSRCWSTQLELVPQRLRCAECGAKHPRVEAAMPIPDLPPPLPVEVVKRERR